MKMIALSIAFLLSVAVLTAAFWMSIIGQGQKEGTENNFPLRLVIGVVTALAIQVAAWNLLLEFPRKLNILLGAGFPIATTLIALALASIIDLFLPTKPEGSESVAGAIVTIGIPALVIGVLLLLLCCVSWLYFRRT
jgi:hypothetical protein